MKRSNLIIPFAFAASLFAIDSSLAGGAYYNFGIYFKFNIPAWQTGADRVKSMPLPTMAAAGWKYPITQIFGRVNCSGKYYNDLNPWQNGQIGVNMDQVFASALANGGQQSSTPLVTLSGPVCGTNEEPDNLDIYLLSADNESHMVAPTDPNQAAVYNENVEKDILFGTILDNLQAGMIKESAPDGLPTYHVSVDTKPTEDRGEYQYPAHSSVLVSCDFMFQLTPDQSQIKSYNLTNCAFQLFEPQSLMRG